MQIQKPNLKFNKLVLFNNNFVMIKMKTFRLLLSFSIFFIILMMVSCEKEEKDIIPPTLTLLGDSVFYLNLDSNYIEPGYTAIDDVDGDISTSVVVSGSVDIHVEGNYFIKYNVTDMSGNSAIEKSRKVRVILF
jgi:hypothetical protein